MYDRYTVISMLDNAVSDGPTYLTRVIDELLVDSEISHKETMRWMRENRNLLPTAIADHYFPVAGITNTNQGSLAQMQTQGQGRVDQLLHKLGHGVISDQERHLLTLELEAQHGGHLA